MRIEYIRISNFKSIDNLEIKDIENALILVGQNNTGKSTIGKILFSIFNSL